MELPDLPEPFLGYVYFDSEAGLSVKGGAASDPYLISRPSDTVRLPMQQRAQPLTESEVRARSLPTRPPWVELYGPQPDPAAPWRNDPHLKGRFHASFPDDLQVLVHDGEPRRTGLSPEFCWVRVVAAEAGPARHFSYIAEACSLSPAEFDAAYVATPFVYVARLLNAPHHLQTLQQGNQLRFLTGGGLKKPLLVTPEYLVERAAWRIQPCNRCGLGETYDAPSVMTRLRFPDAPLGTVFDGFTSRCAECSGSQLLVRRKG